MKLDPVIPLLVHAVLDLVTVDCQTGTQAKALHTQLFVTDSYNSKIRPANDQSLPTAVTVDMVLVALNAIDTVQGTIKITSYLVVQWTDDFLQWTPSSYGGIQEYHWPQSDVWTPDIVLGNSVDQFDGFGSGSDIVLNQANGTLTWLPFEVLTATCAMDVSKFPFDTQTCKILFVSWGYDRSEVTLSGGSIGFGLDGHLSDHTDWELVSRDWSLTSDQNEDVIIFTLKLQRLPSYVLLTVTFPLIILSGLNALTFLIPGGDKIGFSVSILLTFGIFFGVIAMILPETVAIITVYLLLMTSLSAIVCGITILQARCYELDDVGRKVPAFLHFLKKFKTSKVEEKIKPGKTNKVDNSKEINPHEKRNGHFLPPVDEVDIESNGTNKDIEDVKDVTWKDVIDGSDWFFFYLIGVLVIIIFIICLIIGLA